jgi:hypothetical protein
MAHEGVLDRGGKYVSGGRKEERETKEVVAQEKNREHVEAPCSDHVGFIDWEEIGEKEGVLIDSRGRFKCEAGVKSEKVADLLEGEDLEKQRDKKATEEARTEEEPESTLPEEKGHAKRDLKAVKADDAEAPIWLWNFAIRDGLKVDPVNRGFTIQDVDRALDAFRGFLLRRKCRLGVTRSFFAHLKIEHPELQASERIEVRAHYEWDEDEDPEEDIPPKLRYRWRPQFGRATYKAWWNGFWETTQDDKEPGRDAIYRIAEASWWEWDEGSAPIYWRWPPEYRKTIRDGLEIWFSGSKPQWRRPQRVEKDEKVRSQVVKKISKVRKRRYISPGYVRSLTDFLVFLRETATSGWFITVPPAGLTTFCGSPPFRFQRWTLFLGRFTLLNGVQAGGVPCVLVR